MFIYKNPNTAPRPVFIYDDATKTLVAHFPSALSAAKHFMPYTSAKDQQNLAAAIGRSANFSPAKRKEKKRRRFMIPENNSERKCFATRSLIVSTKRT